MAQRGAETANTNMNLLYLRNTINRNLITAKEPESLQVTGISWNQKKTILLFSHNGFKNTDFDLHHATITKTTQAVDSSTVYVNKQEG